MDKRVIFAVAGSGKTTYIVNNLSLKKRSLIITYTNNNLENLKKKITEKFEGKWPEKVTLMSYFSFLYNFCYKPLLSDDIKARGLFYKANPNRYISQNSRDYFITKNGYIYSNRLALLLERYNVINDIKLRIEKYFDELVIDEIQDISGRDFTFLENIMNTDINMLFVGDFYQHTFDTSRDGNINKKLFDNKDEYESRFTECGFVIDNTTLKNSWRCSQSICSYIKNYLQIDISSNRHKNDDTSIEYIEDDAFIKTVLEDPCVIKLHYQNGAKYDNSHKNWGETKGEDDHNDVCVLLNKTTALKRETNKLHELAPSTKNKLYVAITRARGHAFIINE